MNKTYALIAMTLSCSSYAMELHNIKEATEIYCLSKLPLTEKSRNSDEINKMVSIGIDQMGFNLLQEAKKIQNHDAFWEPEKSTEQWKKKVALLKTATWFGNKEAEYILENDLESKRYSKECYDCFIEGTDHDPKKVLAFFWEHVAVLDVDERKSLAQAYKEGEVVYKNVERANELESK